MVSVRFEFVFFFHKIHLGTFQTVRMTKITNEILQVFQNGAGMSEADPNGTGEDGI